METIDNSESCVYGFMKEDKVFYIGSTNNFTKRYASHKSHCNNEKDRDYNTTVGVPNSMVNIREIVVSSIGEKGSLKFEMESIKKESIIKLMTWNGIYPT